MYDLVSSVDSWLEQNQAVACAMVIKTWGSSPRPAGSLMAITKDAHIAGSVSGGCVESAVVASALDVLGEAKMRVEKYHASTQKAHEVGLSCGGDLDVCIYPLDIDVFRAIQKCVVDDQEYLHGIVVEGSKKELWGSEICLAQGQRHGRLNQEQFREIEHLAQHLPKDTNAALMEASFGSVFLKRVLSRPQIISVGATHVSIALMKMAQIMGYRTVVIDPRSVFATEERFSFVDELYHGWPQEVLKSLRITPATALCALTHDPKIDEPALALAVRSEAFYIGSLGRTTTQLERCEGLLARGISREEISRIYGPIGLDIGGKEPTEIALSVLSEINAIKHGKTIQTRTMLEVADAERAKQVMKNAS